MPDVWSKVPDGHDFSIIRPQRCHCSRQLQGHRVENCQVVGSELPGSGTAYDWFHSWICGSREADSLGKYVCIPWKWRHISIMASRVTGSWAVCLTFSSGWRKETTKLLIIGSLWLESTGASTEKITSTWWCHQMETFSALLAICAGIHRSPVNSPHKGQWRGALVFSLNYAWINGCVNNDETGDVRSRHILPGKPFVYLVYTLVEK